MTEDKIDELYERTKKLFKYYERTKIYSGVALGSGLTAVSTTNDMAKYTFMYLLGLNLELAFYYYDKTKKEKMLIRNIL